MSQVLVAASHDALVTQGARWLCSAIQACTTSRGSCSIALAGGTTPRPIYAALASLDVVWSAVHIFFGDERCVPPDAPESNYRLARESLLDAVPIPASQVHRIPGEAPDREAIADQYAAMLPKELDIIVLGIGTDAHTASLFPGSAAVRERTRRVVPSRGPAPPHDRLTLTPPAIESAFSLLMIASGADKAAAVARALSPSAEPVLAPACLARRGVWLLDQAAAGRL